MLLLLSLLPAVAAAGYAIIGATAASMSSARKYALRDHSQGVAQAALDRYLGSQARIETRWLVARTAGIAATAALLTSQIKMNEPVDALIVFGSSLFSYIIPSELGRQFARPRAEQLLTPFLRMAQMGEWLVAPIADPLYHLGTSLTAGVSVREPSATLTEDEVEHLVNVGERDGSLDHEQSEMIRNVLDFGEVTAEELMVPRIHVDALSASLKLHEVLLEVARTKHSRYPVYSESIDNVVGILHVKDLFHAVTPTHQIRPSSAEEVVTTLARTPVAFVPEGQLASTVLREMRAGRHHMAVVVDEFGGVSGILTLEDLLEEIVGDIQDEHDRDDAARIEMLDAHRVLVDASIPVDDINRAVGTDLPDGDYVSLGGLLLEHIGSVPASGSSHEVFGLQVLIVESDERRIGRVELIGVPGAPKALSSHPPSYSEE